MYIHHNLVLDSFKRLAPSDAGARPTKIYTERTTSLMTWLAVDAVSKEYNEPTIDLDHQALKSRRKQFIHEYADLVTVSVPASAGIMSVYELGSVKSNGKDPSARISSNFITTIVSNASKSNDDTAYPGRPAPLLSLGKSATGLPFGVRLHSNWKAVIASFFDGMLSDTPFTDLAIFCMRKVDEQSQSDLVSTLCAMVSKRYSNDLSNFWCNKIQSEWANANHLKSAEFMEASFVDSLSSLIASTAGGDDFSVNEPRQQIYYGAPGTGKSHGVDETAKNLPKEDVVRTTFHPDSDYSTFVGAYKPTMVARNRYEVNQTKAVLMKYPEDDGLANARKDEPIVEKVISYSFVPQAFAKAYVQAWKRMAEAEGGEVKPVMLVIEEINRGNCAQVFGDLFQLLDRGDDGYSTYPIISDSDLADWLASQFVLQNLSDADVKSGRILKLPPNLYIWATMNTSDQSLFPIDSAFKRRWDWKYVPIREGKYKDGSKKGQKLGWKIKFTVPAHQEGSQQIPAKDYSYDWWEFLKNINAKIFKTTESEDKKLGYFFVKPDGEDATTNDGTISADRFVSKVIFYLWNDVFKDYGIETIFKVDDAKKSEDGAKGVEFQAFFNEEDDKADVNTLLRFFKHIELKSDEEIAAAQAAQQQPTASAANQQGQNTNP